ncbi:DUF397 domain-containing protein [Streptomyces sp. DK15]|nr:DUF397 domain-containing protein [Streptomyces sp. DK15]
MLDHNDTIYVRDSKDIDGPALHLGPAQFAGLISLALATSAHL